VLGTDGYGLSESRPALRAHFEVDDEHIVQAALVALYRENLIDPQTLERHLSALSVNPNKANPARPA